MATFLNHSQELEERALQWWGGRTLTMGSQRQWGREKIKTGVQGEEMKLNSQVDNIRFKGRKNMGEAKNTSRQSGHKNRDGENGKEVKVGCTSLSICQES